MIVSAALLLLLAAAAALAGWVSRGLGRPIPNAYLGLFFGLAALPFARAFVSDVTPLPLDHVTYTQPWMSLAPGAPAPYNPNLNDVVTQILPWTEATRIALRQGEWPWRNRWDGSGMALAANSQSGAFSPLMLPALILPLARAFTLIAGLKILLTLAGMWLWLRELGVSARASLFGAVVFAFSLSVSHWIFFAHTSVIALWPWALFLLERSRDAAGRTRVVGALAAVIAGMVLGGHPESAVLGALFAALWVGARWAAGDLPGAVRVAGVGVVAGAIAAGLTAFLLIPSALAILASHRVVVVDRPFWDAYLSWRPHGAAWRGLVTPFFPHALGNGIASPALDGATGAFPEMALGYVGIVAWAGALLVLRPGSRRPRAEWVLLGLIAAGLGAASGLWPFAELAAALPHVRSIFPLRFYSWAALAAAAVSALELDRYAKDARAGKAGPAAPVAAFTAAAFAAGIAFLWFSAEHVRAGGMPFQTRLFALVLGALALAAAAALLPKRPETKLAALTAVAAAELLYHWRLTYRYRDPALLYPPTPLTQFLAAQPVPFRIVGEGPVMFPNTSVFARSEDIRTHDPVERRDYVAFLGATCGLPPLDYFKRVGDVDAPVMDFLNVRFAVAGPAAGPPGARWREVYAGADGRVFENAAVLPRAFAPARVHRVRPRAPSEGPVLDANAAFGEAIRAITAHRDWRAAGWVLGDRDGEDDNGPVEVSAYRETTNRAAFRARVEAPAAYVFLSLVQDGGWSARDASGRTVPVTRANGPFLAVRLPAGDHEVRLRYLPPGLGTGTAISAAAAGLLAACGAARARRRRRPRGTAG